jgi:hypothetical protein
MLCCVWHAGCSASSAPVQPRNIINLSMSAATMEWAIDDACKSVLRPQRPSYLSAPLAYLSVVCVFLSVEHQPPETTNHIEAEADAYATHKQHCSRKRLARGLFSSVVINRLTRLPQSCDQGVCAFKQHNEQDKWKHVSCGKCKNLLVHEMVRTLSIRYESRCLTATEGLLRRMK